MDQEYRYPLTRICLRSGSLTLPLAMLEVFPESGEVTAVDSVKGGEFQLIAQGRRIEGLDEFFRIHELEVNDELVIRPLEDDRFSLTAAKRDRRPDYTRPEVLRRLLDSIVESDVPVTESEIRALHTDIPESFPLRAALEGEPRLALFEGRWQSRLAVEALQRAADLEAQRKRDDARRRAEAAEREEAHRRAEAGEREAGERAAAERAAAAKRAQEERDLLEAKAKDDAGSGSERRRAERGRAERQRPEREAPRAHEASPEEIEAPDDEGGVEGRAEAFEWDQPTGRGFRLPWQRARAPKDAKGASEVEPPSERPTPSDPFRLDRLGEARPSSSRPRVVPAPRATPFPGDAGLNSATLPAADPAKSKRAREAFTSFGYRVEGLAHGQLMLHADLGRHKYRVLLHVLPDNERLDWAALLARRRDSNATYLAVVGDHRDLHRLIAPADLARATLWSWAGIDRAMELSRNVVIGTPDLEPHFERDGVFEYGLERFERTIAKRVQERGTLSAVLTSLANMRAPTVFVLEDLASQGDVPRDQLARVLERLSEAPFHLVARIDSGEYFLRYRVHDALDQLGTYAASLRERLPERQRQRVRGLPEGIEPIGPADLAEAGAQPEAEKTPHVTVRKERRVKESTQRPRLRSDPATTPSDEQEGDDQHALFGGPGFSDDEPSDEVDLSAAVRRTRKPPKR